MKIFVPRKKINHTFSLFTLTFNLDPQTLRLADLHFAE